VKFRIQIATGTVIQNLRIRIQETTGE
jgi:hypothetical protein